MTDVQDIDTQSLVRVKRALEMHHEWRKANDTAYGPGADEYDHTEEALKQLTHAIKMAVYNPSL